jgi:hypothetical protein
MDTNTTATATTTSNTTTSSTRDLDNFTPTSTLDRNTTEESNETAESALGDQESTSDGVPELPGFGAFISFTALITTITLIRYKKH